jgi:hypothetical protein
MLKITIQYTEDNELIEAHCIKDEIETLIAESQIPEMLSPANIKILNPEGEEEQ